MTTKQAAAKKDILTLIAERDAAPVKPQAKRQPAWRVLLGTGRASRPTTYNSARRLAARYNRMFRTDRAYATR